MKTLFKTMTLTVAALCAWTAPQAMAYEAGDWILRGGAAVVAPDVSNSAVLVNGTALPGAEVGVNSNAQPNLTVTYMYNRHLGLELLVATPFKHTVSGEGALAGFGTIAQVTHLPPALSVVYYPLQGFNFQPYVGAGVNYTFFFSEESRIGGSVDLDGSVGVALQGGLDYRLSDRWHINASIRWIDLETDATFTNTGVGRVESTVELDPVVYSVMLGYTF